MITSTVQFTVKSNKSIAGIQIRNKTYLQLNVDIYLKTIIVSAHDVCIADMIEHQRKKPVKDIIISVLSKLSPTSIPHRKRDTFNEPWELKY